MTRGGWEISPIIDVCTARNGVTDDALTHHLLPLFSHPAPHALQPTTHSPPRLPVYILHTTHHPWHTPLPMPNLSPPPSCHFVQPATAPFSQPPPHSLLLPHPYLLFYNCGTTCRRWYRWATDWVRRAGGRAVWWLQRRGAPTPAYLWAMPAVSTCAILPARLRYALFPTSLMGACPAYHIMVLRISPGCLPLPLYSGEGG